MFESLGASMAAQMMGGGGGGMGGGYSASASSSASASTGEKTLKLGDVRSEGTKVTVGAVPGMSTWSMPVMIGAGVIGLVALVFVLKKG